MSEPCDLTALDARDQIKRGDLTVSALLESCIGRINARNPALNAVVTTCFDTARAEAMEMDANRPSATKLPALFGLPVLIKDLIDTKDLRTTYGSLCFENHVPDKDADIVVALRQAGAIILGKTNTPEFGAGANTFNKVFGATRNPHDPARTCGGSSGGSAVAVACGMAPLAIGSDFGGSLRIPASFCGIVGMRPTPGRVPCTGLAVGHSPLWTEGPMARDVADTTLLFSAIEGYAAADPRAAPLARKTRQAPVALDQLRVGVSVDLGIATLNSAIENRFRDSMLGLADAFGGLTEFKIDLRDAPEVFRLIRMTDIVAATAGLTPAQRDTLGDNVRFNLAQADRITFRETAEAAATHTKMFRAFHRLFDRYDLLICPTTAVSPFPVEQPFPKEIDGKPLEDYVSWYALTWALSLMGCPIVALPCGTDHNGLPYGIQIIGPRHQDSFTLNAAASIESKLRG